MCTSLALHTPDFYFGRNLDLEYSFGQQVALAPRDYAFHFRRAMDMLRHYAIIGMATVQEGYPLFAEGANECGLCMAGLNFPGNAYYPAEAEVEGTEKQLVSPFELIPWLLGQCEDVREARALLQKTQLVNIPFSEGIPVATLHWHIADREESIVLESTREGMRVYDNPVHVMTNNPPFDFHLNNLRQYMGVTSAYAENRFADSLPLTSFGNGLGGIGLPGDLSPTSRFVRAAFMLHNTRCETGEESCVGQFFHLLDSVAMPRGSVKTREGLYEITDYSCCYSTKTQTYYYKTYRNNRITAVKMSEKAMAGEKLLVYPLRDAQDILVEEEP